MLILLTCYQEFASIVLFYYCLPCSFCCSPCLDVCLSCPRVTMFRPPQGLISESFSGIAIPYSSCSSSKCTFAFVRPPLFCLLLRGLRGLCDLGRQLDELATKPGTKLQLLLPAAVLHVYPGYVQYLTYNILTITIVVELRRY
ncbi:hypothetical protein B0T19DRAFT_414551 [Cercophora scortea]|uniref:Uncharacterized protein n=1 Tax=Cercophora scortea TaxID=314031 RepID=A0AAE0IVQ8_9PEZI|nr:hypothetical protein B0T19DRAFT_414551 [Cercophora scortea]